MKYEVSGVIDAANDVEAMQLVRWLAQEGLEEITPVDEIGGGTRVEGEGSES